LRAFTEKKEGVISYGPLYGEDGKLLLKPKSWRELNDGVAVVAAEIKTKEEADALKGVKLFVPRANLPATDEDEFYIVDLLGCKAESLDGQVLGVICAVWNFGAGDIIEYRPPNGAKRADHLHEGNRTARRSRRQTRRSRSAAAGTGQREVVGKLLYGCAGSCDRQVMRRFAVLCVALLAGALTGAAQASEEPDGSVQCELALAIWTQAWNETPRQSFNLVPGAQELMDCAWNTDRDDGSTANFTIATIGDGGRTARLQASKNTRLHGEIYDCALTRTGGRWRVVRCRFIATWDAFP
jgi:16S rRNA processing protein RimM